LIPLIAVPVSLVGTFAVMLAMGFSANTVSLLALVLAIGIVVDDAIVVVEAVEANLEKNPELSPADATKKAMGQITGPIIGITMVLLSVFVPVAFIPGISGQLYQQFAVAVSVSMLISAINALSLSPALCALMLRSHHGQKHGLMYALMAPVRYLQKGIDKTRDGYAAVVKVMVRKAVFGLIALAAVCYGVWQVNEKTPTGFLPSEDQGAFFVEIQLPEASSVSRTAKVVEKAEAVLVGTEGVSDLSSIVGYSFLDGLANSPPYPKRI
jgi:multidrug efflux pump subunit AcrB